MLPIIKKTLPLLISLASLHVHAAKIASLDAGDYALKSGKSEWCQDFTIAVSDLGKKNIAISEQYHFKTENSFVKMQSDIDPKCAFISSTKRKEGEAKETVLTSQRQEICSSKITSNIETTATFLPGEIQIRQQINNARPYECVWKKRATKP